MTVRPLTLAAVAAIACSACGLPREPIGPPVCGDPSDLAYWRDVPPPAWWLAECPFDASVIMPDGGVPDDAMVDAGSDAGVDASVADAGDAAIEMMDAGPDAGSDAGRDAGPRDGGPPDSGPPDAGSDAGTDAGPSPIGCGDGTVDQAYPSADMVGCNGSATQCAADTLCGSGWHLCTYSEYEARGGATVVTTAFRWIASCVRRADCTVEATPTDGICGSCSRTGGTATTLGTSCPAGSTLTDTDCPLGAVAGMSSWRLLGESTCTRSTVSATNGLYGATCCR